MTIGIVGRKVGMTRVFTDEGASIPVTVIEATPNRVTQLRSEDVDGYQAVQVTTGSKKASRVTKPMAGHYAKAGAEAGRGLWEFRVEAAVEGLEVGGELKVDIFEPGQIVDVRGTTKGKGFQGVVKRHGFAGGPGYHGAHFHRAPGSIGASADPSRVFPGTRLPGQMGNVRVTQTGLTVVKTDPEKNLVLVKGAIPGSKGSLVVIRG